MALLKVICWAIIFITRQVINDEWNGDVEYICHVFTILIQNLVEPSCGYKSLLPGCKLPNIDEK